MNSSSSPSVLVWWILWAAFLSGVIVMYQVLGARPASSPGLAPGGMWIVAATPVALSVVLRWVVLPRIPARATAFPLFIVGIAMAEAALFLGLFLFPAHKQELFYLSVLGIAQFAPYFAGRYE